VNQIFGETTTFTSAIGAKREYMYTFMFDRLQ